MDTKEPQKSSKLKAAEIGIFIMPWLGYDCICQGLGANMWVWMGGMLILAPITMLFMLWLHDYTSPKPPTITLIVPPELLASKPEPVKPEVRH